MGFIFISGPQTFEYGIYTCQRCKKEYTVLDVWDQCSPEFCAPCLKHLKAQYALLPYPEPKH